MPCELVGLRQRADDQLVRAGPEHAARHQMKFRPQHDALGAEAAQGWS